MAALPFFALDALAIPEAAAIGTEVLTAEVLGAGLLEGAGLGLGQAAGTGIANAFPTIAETVAQTSPQALAQVANAAQPGLQGLSQAQIQNYVGSNPYFNPAYAGQGTQVAALNNGVMTDAGRQFVAGSLNAGAGAGAASVPWQGGVWQGSLGNAAATPFSLSADPLLNPAAAGDLFTKGVTSGMPIALPPGVDAVATFPQSATMAEIMAPGTTYAPAAEATPGLWDKFAAMPLKDKLLYGGAGLMGLQMLMGKNNGVPAAEKYSGPLSKFKYDPGKYTPLTTPQPTPYRPAYHAYAAGGPVEQMSNQNAIGANTGFPMADINHAAYATPYQQPISRNVLSGPQDTNVDPYTGQERFAAGGQTDTLGFTRALRGSPGVLGGLASLVGRNQGMAAPAPTTYGFSPALQMFQNLQAQRAAAPQMPSRPAPIDTYADYANQMAANRAALARPAPAPVQLNPAAFSKYNQPVDTGSPYPGGVAQYESGSSGYAHGGIASLGAYSDGGRMLKGPGDGMSDNIPATIAGKQPARLANEEFVVPADVVSHLGNGSSDAGAKQLYKMMDKVRQARTGTKKQGKQINPDKYLPA